LKKHNIVIVGLGNPGENYKNTRHNVGFNLIELLVEQLNLSQGRSWLRPCTWWRKKSPSGDLILIKPLTFMNRSGDLFPWIKKKFHVVPEQIIVAVDNMDLPPGRLRMKPRGSSAGHNGLKSIIHITGSEDFHRLYIGIGRPVDKQIIEYVLGVPDVEDRNEINRSIFKAAEILHKLPSISTDEVRNAINNL